MNTNLLNLSDEAAKSLYRKNLLDNRQLEKIYGKDLFEDDLLTVLGEIPEGRSVCIQLPNGEKYAKKYSTLAILNRLSNYYNQKYKDKGKVSSKRYFFAKVNDNVTIVSIKSEAQCDPLYELYFMCKEDAERIMRMLGSSIINIF